MSVVYSSTYVTPGDAEQERLRKIYESVNGGSPSTATVTESNEPSYIRQGATTSNITSSIQGLSTQGSTERLSLSSPYSIGTVEDPDQERLRKLLESTLTPDEHRTYESNSTSTGVSLPLAAYGSQEKPAESTYSSYHKETFQTVTPSYTSYDEKPVEPITTSYQTYSSYEEKPVETVTTSFKTYSSYEEKPVEPITTSYQTYSSYQEKPVETVTTSVKTYSTYEEKPVEPITTSYQTYSSYEEKPVETSYYSSPYNHSSTYQSSSIDYDDQERLRKLAEGSSAVNTTVSVVKPTYLTSYEPSTTETLKEDKQISDEDDETAEEEEEDEEGEEDEEPEGSTSQIEVKKLGEAITFAADTVDNAVTSAAEVVKTTAKTISSSDAVKQASEVVDKVQTDLKKASDSIKAMAEKVANDTHVREANKVAQREANKSSPVAKAIAAGALFFTVVGVSSTFLSNLVTEPTASQGEL